MENYCKILTHDGKFQTDEVLAIALISFMYPNFDLTRSRKQNIEDFEWVVDVGGIYDPTRNLYDHHQKGYHETWNENTTTLLSSSGLVFRDNWENILTSLNIENPTYEEATSLYFYLFESIDRHDNGQSNDESWFRFSFGKIHSRGMPIGVFISSFNYEYVKDGIQNIHFNQAVDWVKIGFSNMITQFIRRKRQNENTIKSLQNREVINHMIFLKNKEYVNKNIISQIDIHKQIRYCIFSSQKEFRVMNMCGNFPKTLKLNDDIKIVSKTMAICKTRNNCIQLCEHMNDVYDDAKNRVFACEEYILIVLCLIWLVFSYI